MDDELAQHLAAYDTAKDAYDAAKERLDEISSAIKSLARSLILDETDAALLSTVALRRPLRLSRVTSWRLDAKAMKEKDPLLYATYARQIVSYRLERIGRGDEFIDL